MVKRKYIITGNLGRSLGSTVGATFLDASAYWTHGLSLLICNALWAFLARKMLRVMQQRRRLGFTSVFWSAFASIKSRDWLLQLAGFQPHCSLQSCLPPEVLSNTTCQVPQSSCLKQSPERCARVWFCHHVLHDYFNFGCSETGNIFYLFWKPAPFIDVIVLCYWIIKSQVEVKLLQVSLSNWFLAPEL